MTGVILTLIYMSQHDQSRDNLIINFRTTHSSISHAWVHTELIICSAHATQSTVYREIFEWVNFRGFIYYRQVMGCDIRFHEWSQIHEVCDSFLPRKFPAICSHMYHLHDINFMSSEFVKAYRSYKKVSIVQTVKLRYCWHDIVVSSGNVLEMIEWRF